MDDDAIARLREILNRRNIRFGIANFRPKARSEVWHILDNEADTDAKLAPLLDCDIEDILDALSRPVVGAFDEPVAKEPRPAADQEVVEAPFRMVALNDKVALASEIAVSASEHQDTPLPDGYCATIEVEWAVETALLIGEQGGQDKSAVPMRLGNDDYIIPGSSLRGMLRAAAEIVAHGRLGQLNKHHVYGVRDFTHPSTSQDDGSGNLTSKLTRDKIHAGWLRKLTEDDLQQWPELSSQAKAGDWVIQPCEKWRLIEIVGMRRDVNSIAETVDDVRFHAHWLKMPLVRRYTSIEYSYDADSRAFVSQTAYTFTESGNGYVDRSEAGETGYYVFSDMLGSLTHKDVGELASELQDEKNRHKKREAVFFDPAVPAKPVPLSEEVIENFELINGQPGRNGAPSPTGNWATLKPTLREGHRVPVFFTGDLEKQDRNFQFSLTRVFKLRHDYGVRDKLAKSAGHLIRPDDFSPDKVEALFGHIYEDRDFDPKGTAADPLQRRGRISIGHASLKEPGSATVSGSKTVTMVGPRGSYAPFYLKGQHKDWSDADAQLAGRKRFFPRFAGPAEGGHMSDIATNLVKTKGTAEMTSSLTFLIPSQGRNEIRFSGTIRLHNVTAAEIGMALWTLTHGGDPAKPCRHMIGRAKPAGAGQMRVAALKLSAKPNKASNTAYIKDPEAWELPGNGAEGWLMDGSNSMAPFLKAFEDEMKASEQAWPQTSTVKEFLGVSQPATTASLSDWYPGLQQGYKDMKDASKLMIGSNARPSAYGKDHRFVGADKLAVQSVKTPYRN